MIRVPRGASRTFHRRCSIAGSSLSSQTSANTLSSAMPVILRTSSKTLMVLALALQVRRRLNLAGLVADPVFIGASASV